MLSSLCRQLAWENQRQMHNYINEWLQILNISALKYVLAISSKLEHLHLPTIHGHLHASVFPPDSVLLVQDCYCT